MGPLEMMYGWQALLCATAAVGVTSLVKTLLNLTMGVEKRKTNKWVSQLVLPTTPILVGAIYAMVIPLRPEVLMEYVAEHANDGWMYPAFAGWGAACGQFSTMLHQKLKDFLQAARAQG